MLALGRAGSQEEPIRPGEEDRLATPHASKFTTAEALTEEDVIPVLDLGPFLAGEPGALQTLGAGVRRALEEIGFFFIKNHGVPQTLVDRVFDENVRFHAQSLEEKMSISVNEKGLGYMASGLQQAKYRPDEPDRRRRW